MKNIFISFIAMFLFPVLLMAQLDDSSIISNDSILMVDPGDVHIHGVIPGSCKAVDIRIRNIGIETLTISALYLNNAEGTDNFDLVDPKQVPFELDSSRSFIAKIEYCPEELVITETELIVEYGVGKIMSIPLKGSPTIIYDMEWCEDFNDWDIGELRGGGWTCTPANASVYITSLIPGYRIKRENNYSELTIPLKSKALILRNGVITPGINVYGENPVISWLEFYHRDHFGYFCFESGSRNLYISTDRNNWDLVDSYLTREMLDKDTCCIKKVYSLKDYIGKTIWWKFEGSSQQIFSDLWIIDDVCFHQSPPIPILNHRPEEINLGGVNVGESEKQRISITNEGLSIARVTGIELISDNNSWSLIDTNNYPVELHDGDYAFAINGTDMLCVDVTFTPENIGELPAKLIVTWGLDEEYTYEISLIGKGFSCLAVEEAHKGENWASSQDSWFYYTADRPQVININSCHPNQEIKERVRYETSFLYPSDCWDYGYDTYLIVFDNCEGNVSIDRPWDNPNVIAYNDDFQERWDDEPCTYNFFSSKVQFAMNAGETVYLYWPWVWRSPHDDEGFFFNIEPTYPFIDGDICDLAIPLTLPVINHFGTTVGFADNYDESPCNFYNRNYIDGNDKVYIISIDNGGYLKGSIIGEWGTIHVLDECPYGELEEGNCIAYVGGQAYHYGGEFEAYIEAGTYYVIISSWAPPQTVDYLLNLSFQGLGVDNDELQSSINVYPNPTNDIFTVSINNKNVRDIILELVDISGQTVYRNQAKSVYSYTAEIDASSFARGIYYLKVNDGENVQIKKMVVQ
jgi:hypothetical protein